MPVHSWHHHKTETRFFNLTQRFTLTSPHTWASHPNLCRVLGFTFYLESFIDASDHQISPLVTCQFLRTSARKAEFRLFPRILPAVFLFWNFPETFIFCYPLAPGGTSSRTRTNVAITNSGHFKFFIPGSCT